MHFIGILGILAILLLGFLLSANRKIIKIRIVLWGLGLQFLFAIIILSNSIWSWIGMFLFFFLIQIYIFRDRLTLQPWSQNLLPGAIILAATVALVGFFYWLESFHVATLFFYAVILAMIVLGIIKRAQVNKYLFASLLCIALGIIYQRGVLGKVIFQKLSDGVDKFLRITDAGSIFLFGKLADPQYFDQFGFQFAFGVLPTIIFFSTIMSILYYLGVMQFIVEVMAKFMRWTMGTSGAETLSCSANVFVGQTEAPLLIRPFLKDMTASELHAIMVGGFATIAGGVLAGYIRMGVNAGHLIAASVMSAPAALVMAKLFLPESEHSKTAGDVAIPKEKNGDNILDAAARGVTDGLKLAVNVGAMLIAFIALIKLLDVILGGFDSLIDGRLLGGALNTATGEYSGIFPGSLKKLLGTIFSPLAFLMGAPRGEVLSVGNLLGIKIAANEFVAYAELAHHIQAADLSPRSIVIATYALCGFANFASIGIQIGGISALAPERRSDLARVALRAMFAGALASWMTACIAGLLT